LVAALSDVAVGLPRKLRAYSVRGRLSYLLINRPRTPPALNLLLKKTWSCSRPSSLNPSFFARAMLALFSAKVHHPTLWRFSCSHASSSMRLVTSVPYPLSHLSFSPMHKPRSALWYLRAQVWNLIEDHPIAFPLDFSWIMYRRTSGSSPFRSFSISASIDTIDFTWSGMDRASVMTASSFCHL